MLIFQLPADVRGVVEGVVGLLNCGAAVAILPPSSSSVNGSTGNGSSGNVSAANGSLTVSEGKGTAKSSVRLVDVNISAYSLALACKSGVDGFVKIGVGGFVTVGVEGFEMVEDDVFGNDFVDSLVGRLGGAGGFGKEFGRFEDFLKATCRSISGVRFSVAPICGRFTAGASTSSSLSLSYRPGGLKTNNSRAF